MKALFQEPICDSTKLRRGFFKERDPNTSFFLCRPMETETGYKNNDIVKFKVQDVESYNRFSSSILSYFEKHLKDDAKPLNILNYFTKLHGYIKAFEGKAKEAISSESQTYLQAFNLSAVKPSEVIAVTGPGLLDKRGECSGLGVVHPRVASWEWHGTELLTDRELAGPCDQFSSKNSVCETVQRSFNLYANRLNDALYAKKFGEDHPFYVALKAYLIQHFPYDGESFEALVKEGYERNRKMRTGDFLSYEEWKPLFLAEIKTKAPDDRPVGPDDSYYARLLSILNTLGINVE
jgi:hypothetical protein